MAASSYADCLKTDAEIERLKLAEAKAYAKDLTKQFKKMYDHLFNENDGVIPKLQSQLAVSQRINERFLSQLNDVEKQTTSNAQYARRETLELHGVPDSFNDNEELEAKVVNLLNDIAPDANVAAKDLHAVHRLKKRQNVIIKFVSRKTQHAVITKKAKLKDDDVKRRHGISGGIYLNESMCGQVKYLFYLCKLLKNENKIAYYTFFNGSIRAKKDEEGPKHTIGHISDLVKLTGMGKDEIEQLKHH